MTKEEAIKILNNALAQISTTRQGHELLIQAMNVLIAEQKNNDSLDK